MPPQKDRQTVNSLVRGLEILRCFQDQGQSFTVSEIARRVGLPQPTVWRLCHTLVERGFLIKSADTGRVSVGLAALTLGYAALASTPVSDIALPLMQELTARTGAGTSLSLRHDLDMVYVQRCHGEFVFLNQPVGARNPIAIAPSGWAYLAGSDAPARKTLLDQIKRADRRTWSQTSARIATALTDYSKDGFVISERVLHEQFNAIAIPVIGPISGAVWALSLGGLASTWPRKRLAGEAKSLHQVAAALAPIIDRHPS